MEGRHEATTEFAAWRRQARSYLQAGQAPGQVRWEASEPGQGELAFAAQPGSLPPALEPVQAAALRVPPAFMQTALLVSAHRDADRWDVLYRVLWRLTHGEPHLLQIEVDDDVLRLARMAKAVSRDIHKMHAFVRFRKQEDAAGKEHYLAWHRPDHAIVELGAPFFQRRFRSMRWSILTPDGSAHWDLENLSYGPGVPTAPPAGDELEGLWQSYYASIFNPARIKLDAMHREMPRRHWPTLPETRLIDQMLADAPGRVAAMLKHQPLPVAELVPASNDLHEIKAAAGACRACSVCQGTTQTVFGSGPEDARIMLIGEQPGDQEDLAGEPFVGPAGQVLNAALAAAGLRRKELYLTNAVKHFKHEQTGKVRLHKTPDSRDVAACKPWLAAELRCVNPEVVICLGLTAAQAVLGRVVRLGDERGRILRTAAAAQTLITTHPAAILRTPEGPAREEAYARMVAELKLLQGTSSLPTGLGRRE